MYTIQFAYHITNVDYKCAKLFSKMENTMKKYVLKFIIFFMFSCFMFCVFHITVLLVCLKHIKPKKTLHAIINCPY